MNINNPQELQEDLLNLAAKYNVQTEIFYSEKHNYYDIDFTPSNDVEDPLDSGGFSLLVGNNLTLDFSFHTRTYDLTEPNYNDVKSLIEKILNNEICTLRLKTSKTNYSLLIDDKYITTNPVYELTTVLDNIQLNKHALNYKGDKGYTDKLFTTPLKDITKTFKNSISTIEKLNPHLSVSSLTIIDIAKNENIETKSKLDIYIEYWDKNKNLKFYM